MKELLTAEAIKPDQTVMCSDPDKPMIILGERRDQVAGEAVTYVKIPEIEHWLAKRCFRK